MTMTFGQMATLRMQENDQHNVVTDKCSDWLNEHQHVYARKIDFPRSFARFIAVEIPNYKMLFDRDSPQFYCLWVLWEYMTPV